MTPDLAQALEKGTPPFRGVTLVFESGDVEILCHAYRLISTLAHHFTPDGDLLQVADWDRHDGIVGKAEACDRGEWLTWATSPTRLREAWRAEDWVHRGVYPSTREWYLRFLLWEREGDADDENSLDFSGPQALIESGVAALSAANLPEGKLLSSLDYFAQTGYTGFRFEPS